METLIRTLFILAAVALPGIAPAASLPGLGSDIAALPSAGKVPADKPDCWVNHVQVQPGSSSGASGSESVIVVGAADIGKLESAGHPGSEHRKSDARRSPACGKQLERRQSE